MNILVCVKQVPDTTEIKIDPVKNTLIRDGVPSILNPFDGYALEAAARIKDKNPDAKLIEHVEVLDERVMAMAGGAGTVRGTGGMATKLQAAQMVVRAGIPMCILNGKDPTVLYRLLDGEHVGTYFAANA